MGWVVRVRVHACKGWAVCILDEAMGLSVNQGLGCAYVLKGVYLNFDNVLGLELGLAHCDLSNKLTLTISEHAHDNAG